MLGSTEALLTFLSEKEQFVAAKIASGANPAPAQIAQLFNAMGERVRMALPTLPPAVSSGLNQAFSTVGWDVFHNASTSTVPPLLPSVGFALQIACQNLQFHLNFQKMEQANSPQLPRSDSPTKEALPPYTRSLMNHAVVVDIALARRAELGEVVVKRLVRLFVGRIGSHIT
jgi:hypothetical protein